MGEIKICILGDICPTDDYRQLFDGKNSQQLFGGCSSIITEADLTICNFECPATESRKPIKKCGPNLRANPSDVAFLKKTGINVFSLANNHIKDFGFSGVEDTIYNCEKANVRYVGAGSNSVEARRPLIIDVEDISIGILSFAEEEFNLAYANEPGANHFDPYQSFDDIRELKKKVGYLIVLYHGGIEHYQYPSPQLQRKCRKIVEAGADIVLCQHSHCIGTQEKYLNGHILYGQGNSVFGYREGSSRWNEGLMVEVDISGINQVTINYRLMNATKDGIVLASDADSDIRIAEMNEESAKILDDDFVADSWKQYALSQESLDLPLLYGKGRFLNKLNRVLNGRIMDFMAGSKKRMVTMNLLRCEAHREVIQTILEESYKIE